MPVKNFLSLSEQKYLQESLKKEERPEVREQISIFFLENDGKNYQEIANFLGCCARTVAYWATHGSPNNIETLEDKRRKGHHQKATEEYIKILIDLVDKEPEQFGYEFGRWTGQRLSEHMLKQTGIALSKSSIVRILKKKKCVYFGKIQFRGQTKSR
jgi:transposase